MNAHSRTHSGNAAFPPRYCQSCQRARISDSNLCAECGDTLISQGYCHVCESFMRAKVGTPCPKHEIPLEDWADDPESTIQPGDWVTVLRVHHPSAALAPRLRLEAEGIPSFLEGERMGPETALAAGGLRLLVPDSHAEQALEILREVADCRTDRLNSELAESTRNPASPTRPLGIHHLLGAGLLLWTLTQLVLLLLGRLE